MTATTMAVRATEDDAEAQAQADLDAQGRALVNAADLLTKRYSRGQIDAQDKLLGLCRLISEASGEDPFTGEARYSSLEVLGWFARAAEMDCEIPVVGGVRVRKLFTVEEVPNACFRARFEELYGDREGASDALALRLGITRTEDGHTTGDGTAVERMLGIKAMKQTHPDGEEYLQLRLFITYDQAVALADALDLDYPNVGV